MEISISGQLAQAALAVAAGGALGFVYDILRIPRGAFRSRAATAAADLLFWLCAAPALFALAMWSDAGAVRVGTLILAGVGAVLYCLTLGRLTARICDRAARALHKGLCAAAAPAAALCRRGKKLLKKSKTLFPITTEWFKISSDANRRAGGRGESRTAPEVARNEAQTGKYYY